MNRAERAASTMSQASARLAPAPAATPLTAQTTGFSSARSRRIRGLYQRLDGRAEIELLVGRHVAVAEVLAGAEPLAGAGEQHGAHLGLALHAIDRRPQRRVHRLVEAVELVGPVERDLQHRTVQLDQKGLAHPSHLPFVQVAAIISPTGRKNNLTLRRPLTDQVRVAAGSC